MFNSFWVRSFLLYALLVGLAFTGARLVSTTLVMREFVSSPTADAISETRDNIDNAFERLAPAGVDRYEFWANLVETALDNSKLAAANGYMLGAVQILEKNQSDAIVAASRELTLGSEDERLIHAVALFLPNHVREKFDRVSNPYLRNKATGFVSEYAEETGQGRPDVQNKSNFKMLGTPSDLVAQAENWVRDATEDSIALKLMGLANILELEDQAMIETLSILMASAKSGRLNLEFRESLRETLEATLPDDVLVEELSQNINEISPMRQRIANTLEAFNVALNIDALGLVANQAPQIEALVKYSDYYGTLYLLELAHDWTDVRRLRLIAEAGGLRAAALADYLDTDVLLLSESGFRWSLAFVYNLMLIVSLALSIVWLGWITLDKTRVQTFDQSLASG